MRLASKWTQKMIKILRGAKAVVVHAACQNAEEGAHHRGDRDAFPISARGRLQWVGTVAGKWRSNGEFCNSTIYLLSSLLASYDWSVCLFYAVRTIELLLVTHCILPLYSAACLYYLLHSDHFWVISGAWWPSPIFAQRWTTRNMASP